MTTLALARLAIQNKSTILAMKAWRMAEGQKNSDVYDLRTEFNRLNNKLFDGQIEPVTLKWSNKRQALGSVVVTNKQVKELQISNFYSMTREQFENTLVHEMIHVRLVQTGDHFKQRGGAHGSMFKAWATKMNSHGYKITEYDEDPASLKLSDTSELKKPVFALMILEGNTPVYVVFSSSRNGLPDLLKTFCLNSKSQKKKWIVNLILTTNREVLTFPVARTFNFKSIYKYSDRMSFLLEEKPVRSALIFNGEVVG